MESFKAGVVTVIGRPNVGKSTLVNHLLGKKISSTSRKSNTTRNRILGYLNHDDYQMVFVDTPGFERLPKYGLNKKMMSILSSSLEDIDVVLFLVDSLSLNSIDVELISLIDCKIPVILVINKSDRLSSMTDESRQEKLKDLVSSFAKHLKRDAVPYVMISAKYSNKLNLLIDYIYPLLSSNLKYADDYVFTDRSENFLLSEILREKVFRILGDELPYSTAVIVDKLEKDCTKASVLATIIADKDSHKKIIIGKKGSLIKTISIAAREDMERYLGVKVYLRVWVKIVPGWRNTVLVDDLLR